MANTNRLKVTPVLKVECFNVCVHWELNWFYTSTGLTRMLEGSHNPTLDEPFPFVVAHLDRELWTEQSSSVLHVHYVYAKQLLVKRKGGEEKTIWKTYVSNFVQGVFELRKLVSEFFQTH